MSESLCGSYRPSIDGKGRMSFPKELRDILGVEFYLLKGYDAKYIAVYSVEEYNKYCDELSQKLTGPKGAAIKRKLISSANKQVPDRQGRIFITQELREYAGITDDITVIGNLNRAEIWDSAKLTEAIDNIDPEEEAAALADLAL